MPKGLSIAVRTRACPPEHLCGLSRRRTPCWQDRLVREYGQTRVTLSSANSISHDKIRAPLARYLARMRSQARHKHGNETFYLFGPVQEISKDLGPVVAKYHPPPLASSDLAYSFGIGAPGSGVPFHVHGQGWSEVVHGAKVRAVGIPATRPAIIAADRIECWHHSSARRRDLGLGGGPTCSRAEVWPAEVVFVPAHAQAAL